MARKKYRIRPPIDPNLTLEDAEKSLEEARGRYCDALKQAGQAAGYASGHAEGYKAGVAAHRAMLDKLFPPWRAGST